MDCEYCGIALDKSKFNAHMKIHLDFILGRGLTQTTHKRQKVECNICGVLLSSKNALKYHVNSIHDENALKKECNVCEPCIYR